jgi:O-antigen ligase
MLMSGAFWIIFCMKEYLSPRYYWLLIVPACSVIFLAMAMSGGRAGYASWAITGVFFALFKWRKYLLFAPVIVITVILYAPSVVDRLTQGMHTKNDNMTDISINFEQQSMDTHSITSGRVIAWPLVWQSITQAPYWGYGRVAMKNIGITTQIMLDYGIGESFPHPHNAYLEWLLNNGFIGSIPIFIFYLLMLKYAYSLFKEKENSLYIVTGGMCLGSLLTFLLAAFGSQTFYPREGAVAMWVMIALMLRVYCERKKVMMKIESNLITEKEKVYLFRL